MGWPLKASEGREHMGYPDTLFGLGPKLAIPIPVDMRRPAAAQLKLYVPGAHSIYSFDVGQDTQTRRPSVVPEEMRP